MEKNQKLYGFAIAGKFYGWKYLLWPKIRKNNADVALTKAP